MFKITPAVYYSVSGGDDTGTATNPVLPGDQFTLSMTLKDSTGTGLDSPSTNFTVLTNGFANASYNISSSGGSGDVLFTEEFGLTSVGVEFLGKSIGGKPYYEYEARNNCNSGIY